MPSTRQPQTNACDSNARELLLGPVAQAWEHYHRTLAPFEDPKDYYKMEPHAWDKLFFECAAAGYTPSGKRLQLALA